MNALQLKQYLELIKLSGVDEIMLTTPLNKLIQIKQTNTDTTPKIVNKPKYSFDDLEKICLNCQNCKLSKLRKNVVFGEGNTSSDILIIGEAPGQQEDIEGKPFVGAAGQLLTKMLKAIDIDRKDIYIANIIKCRPPGNRDPEPDEVKACVNYLNNQISLIKPKVILLLGRIAGQTLLNTKLSLGKLRISTHEYMGIKVFITYHPSALLRHAAWKKPAWEDLQKFRDYYKTL